MDMDDMDMDGGRRRGGRDGLRRWDMDMDMDRDGAGLRGWDGTRGGDRDRDGARAGLPRGPLGGPSVGENRRSEAAERRLEMLEKQIRELRGYLESERSDAPGFRRILERRGAEGRERKPGSEKDAPKGRRIERKKRPDDSL